VLTGARGKCAVERADRGGQGITKGLAPEAEKSARCGVAPTEQLCLSCGMCCDGTLFDGVKLEPGDDAQKLKALGLPVTFTRGRKPVARFPQPCVALCKDRVCQVYADRPNQCRTFECKLFKETRDGAVTIETAMKLVKKTQRLADRARRLLRKLGDDAEQLGLGERVHRIDERLQADGSDSDALALYADLSLVVHRLTLLAHERFYTHIEESKKPRG
jgi:Fe-S-cluster containining protein